MPDKATEHRWQRSNHGLQFPGAHQSSPSRNAMISPLIQEYRH